MGNEVSTFQHGRIEVRLQKLKFYAGEVVQGSVHVSLSKACFPVSALTIGLYGIEHVYFERADSDNSKHKRLGRFEIVKLVDTIETYRSGEGPVVGQRRVYPFTLTLPDWLPNSFELQHNLA